MTSKLPAIFADVMDRDDTVRRIDLNGWINIDRNPISVAGVYPYLGAKIPGADPTQIYFVLRPAEELSSPETLESCKLLPWINDHVMLGPIAGRTPAEQKGVEGVTGEQISFEGDTLYANLKLYSQELADEIDAGKIPLSLGYTGQFEYNPGIYKGQPYQYILRTIRGNHLASVKVGRMGAEVSVLDNLFDETATDMNKKQLRLALAALHVTLGKQIAVMDADDTPPAEGEPKPKEGESDVSAMTLEEATAMLAELMPQITKLQAVVAGGATPAADPLAAAAVTDEAEKAAQTAAKDKETAAVMDALEARIQAAIPTEAVIVANISRRNALAKQLSEHVGVFDHDDLTFAQVVAYGIDKLGIKSTKDPVSVLEGYLLAKPSPRASLHAVADVMDSVDAAGKPNAVKRFLAGPAK